MCEECDEQDSNSEGGMGIKNIYKIEKIENFIINNFAVFFRLFPELCLLSFKLYSVCFLRLFRLKIELCASKKFRCIAIKYIFRNNNN